MAWANFNNDTSGGPGGDDGDDDGGDGLKASAAPTSNPPKDNHNQMLLARSTDGGASFSAPVKVGDYFDLPDCATYQNGADAGRACVPEKADTANSIFRATNYPVGAVNPRTGAVVVTYGSYINKHSNENNGCVPTGFSDFGLNTYDGVKVPGACNNDILVSTSTNHGATFNGGTTDARQMPTVTEARGSAHHGPVLAVGGLHRSRQAGRRLLRPPVRQRRGDRVLRLLGDHQLALVDEGGPRHQLVQPAADAVHRPVHG